MFEAATAARIQHCAVSSRMKCLKTVASIAFLALCFHVACAEVVNLKKCPGEE
uniref:Uncharacterized protein n=1 Tax=Anopheles dirus TaxID=7168 RepID=A0A182NVU9_9DIPT